MWIQSSNIEDKGVACSWTMTIGRSSHIEHVGTVASAKSIKGATKSPAFPKTLVRRDRDIKVHQVVLVRKAVRAFVWNEHPSPIFFQNVEQLHLYTQNHSQVLYFWAGGSYGTVVAAPFHPTPDGQYGCSFAPTKIRNQPKIQLHIKSTHTFCIRISPGCFFLAAGAWKNSHPKLRQNIPSVPSGSDFLTLPQSRHPWTPPHASLDLLQIS